MRIVIDIPDYWMRSSSPMIDIEGDNFLYSSICESMHGIQSNFSQKDEEKEKLLKESCDKIVDEVRYLLKNELI